MFALLIQDPAAANRVQNPAPPAAIEGAGPDGRNLALLAGSAAVGMHVCHGTLRGLRMHLLPPEPTFARSTTTLEIHLTNERRTPRRSIALSVADTGHWTWSDVPAQGEARVTVTFQPGERGRHRVPALTAETRYPLGTFRVWTVWRPAASVVVYPVPEPRAPALPPGEPRAGGAQATSIQHTGEFDGVRAYRRGDPRKLVLWKKLAKADELISRDGQQAQRHELWLDYEQAGLPGKEARLSRLCAWVLAADRLGIDYGLRLPGLAYKPASGAAHRLNRNLAGAFGSKLYSVEEITAELISAFCCASLGIVPTVRHADYIGSWLD